MEMVVVMGLFVLLTVLLGDFLLDLARSSGVASVRAGLQSQALLHSEAMLATARQTTLTGLAVRGDGGRPGFLATLLATVTSTGQRVWAPRLIGYYWAPSSHTLYELKSPPGGLPNGLAFSATQPPEFTATQLDGMFTGGRPLSERVTAFEVSLNGVRLRLRLVLEQAVPRSNPQRCELIREITMMSP